MRSLSNAFRTEITKSEVCIGAIVEIDYPTSPVRAWSGVGDLNWDGKTWKGIGDFGDISAIMEKTSTESVGVRLTLNGVPAEARAQALANTSASRKMRFWLAAFSEASDGSWSVLPDPWRFLSGITDTHKLQAGAIEVNIETAFARLRQARIARYNNEEQQRYFPGDLGFEFGAKLNEQPFYWGVAAPATAGGGHGTGVPHLNLPIMS